MYLPEPKIIYNNRDILDYYYLKKYDKDIEEAENIFKKTKFIDYKRYVEIKDEDFKNLELVEATDIDYSKINDNNIDFYYLFKDKDFNNFNYKLNKAINDRINTFKHWIYIKITKKNIKNLLKYHLFIDKSIPYEYYDLYENPIRYIEKLGRLYFIYNVYFPKIVNYTNFNPIKYEKLNDLNIFFNKNKNNKKY